jgi:chromosomal replication initiation ATPase DnaA
MDIFYGKRGSGKTHELIQRIMEHATQRILDKERMKEISEAIIRFVDAGKPIPAEWFEELNEINDRRNK